MAIHSDSDTRHASFLHRAWRLYADGFRDLGPTGRSVWVLLLVKLAIIFLVFKLLLFPNLLSRDYDNDADRAAAVRSALIEPRR